MRNIDFKEVLLEPGQGPGELELVPRRDRLPQFLGMTADPAHVLDSCKLAIVAVGSVGARIALHAARLQVDTLFLVDQARFKSASLATQPVLPDAIGQWKASYVGRMAKQISPRTRVLVYDGPVQALDPLAFAGVQAAIVSGDNLAVEVDMAQRCLSLGVPLITAAVYGDALLAHVKVIANRDGTGPCLACTFSKEEWDHLNAGTSFKCVPPNQGEPVMDVAVQPTMSVSSLCSIAADLAMMQLQRDLLGLGKPVRDTLLEYCGYTHRTVISPLERKPDCPCDHVTWQQRSAPRPLAECSLAELAHTAGINGTGGLPRVSFTVADLVFAPIGKCAAGHSASLLRFVKAQESAGQCPTCGGPLFAPSFESHRRAPSNAVSPVLHRPLGEIAAPAPEWVLLRGDEDAVLFTEARP